MPDSIEGFRYVKADSKGFTKVPKRGWPSKMHECIDQLAGKLHKLTESSLKENWVPLDWKRANVVPIQKGDKEEPLNYRPVSLTSIVATVCEKIVKDRWFKFLKEKNTLFGDEFGFRGRKNLLRFYSCDWCDTGKRGKVWLHLPGPQKGCW